MSKILIFLGVLLAFLIATIVVLIKANRKEVEDLEAELSQAEKKIEKLEISNTAYTELLEHERVIKEKYEKKLQEIANNNLSGHNATVELLQSLAKE